MIVKYESRFLFSRHKNFIYLAALNLPCEKSTSQEASFSLGHEDTVSK